MTANETKRLNEWLIAIGITPTQALKCIDYIATGDTVHIIRKPKNKPKERKKRSLSRHPEKVKR